MAGDARTAIDMLHEAYKAALQSGQRPTLQFGLGEQPFQCRVLLFEVCESCSDIGFNPPNRLRHYVIRRTAIRSTGNQAVSFHGIAWVSSIMGVLSL
ncbi:hypothetical protein B0T44_12640 [Nocardia donostiensis]|uniref:Uncharacterized protein n=1 Tax=Nocardia donostiensis TaxID=1538463 RepID=A0A1W0BBE2_9NOCA|nr:hypothetical protein B0T46_04970 [Nocardia donostiensis]OQS19859.1 hypothetical protein B0T44_12640 [Nocardia donostiensis]